MLWLIMAVLSALFAGLTSILAKCGIRKTDSDVATGLRTIVVLLFSWLMVFITSTRRLNRSCLTVSGIWSSYFSAGVPLRME